MQFENMHLRLIHDMRYMYLTTPIIVLYLHITAHELKWISFF